jgi:hypothetical protein
MMRAFRSGSWWALGLLVAAAAGFWRPYLSQITSGVDVLTHIHAASMGAWLCLLVAQPALAASGRRRAHVWVGRASYVLVPAIVLATSALAWRRLNDTAASVGSERAALLFVQIAPTAIFTAMYTLAMRHRRTSTLHARDMIATGLVMIDPVVARVLLHLTPLTALSWHVIDLVTVPVLLALILWERRTFTDRIYPGVLALFMSYQFAATTFAHSSAWRWVAVHLAAW